MIFETSQLLLLLGLILAAAALYSAVGQGGGSGYLAAMALLGLAPATMKPAALAMNVAVTLLALWRLRGVGRVDRAVFAPLLAASLPAAALGGAVLPAAAVYAVLVGLALVVAAGPLLLQARPAPGRPAPGPLALLALGAVIGLVSGLTGVGGGIFLAPLLLLAGWADMPSAMRLSSLFILLNSGAALAGFGLAGGAWPEGLAPMVGAALLGALIGTALALRNLHGRLLRRLLGIVLLIAAARMILGAIAGAAA